MKGFRLSKLPIEEIVNAPPFGASGLAYGRCVNAVGDAADSVMISCAFAGKAKKASK